MEYQVRILNRSSSDLDDSVHALHINAMINMWKGNSTVELNQEFTFTENGTDKHRRDYSAIRYRNMSIIKRDNSVLVFSIMVPIKM